MLIGSMNWLQMLLKMAYDKSRCLAIVKSHIDKDTQEINLIETHEKEDKDGGMAPALRSGARKIELLEARASLNYHKRVEAFINQL